MNNPGIIKRLNSQLAISNYILQAGNDEILSEIMAGLSEPQKHISSRFFYDDAGSALFEEITRLPEYYPTRTEISILREVAPFIMEKEDLTEIVELGSGDCSKISILLDALPAKKLEEVRYIPVDVSRTAIMKSAGMLSGKYPAIKIDGILADFMKLFELNSGEGRKLICFFGSTLGNLTGHQQTGLLRNLKALMNPGDHLLIGMDMVKDIKILEDAYNDKQEITVLFNKNILRVVNHIALTNFNPDQFEHVAFYDAAEARIEMHLRAHMDVEVSSACFTGKIQVKKGETIHTENSHKYTLAAIHQLAGTAGLSISNIYTDDHRWFSLVHFQ